jgi:NADP-dependent 3-hydroxy acid dehydrogenase YdfG
VMDTNFYGVVNITRAAVPLMREQRSGCILQISSVGGRLTRPGSTPYHAAKWAGCRRLHGISCPGAVSVRREGVRP